MLDSLRIILIQIVFYFRPNFSFTVRTDTVGYWIGSFTFFFAQIAMAPGAHYFYWHFGPPKMRKPRPLTGDDQQAGIQVLVLYKIGEFYRPNRPHRPSLI